MRCRPRPVRRPSCFSRPRALALVVQKHVNGERAVVVRAFLLDDHVARDTEPVRLGVFEEPALVVLVGGDDGSAANGIQDLSFDETPCRVESAVEVDGGDERFEGVGDDGFVPFADGLRGAGAHQDEVREAERSCVGGEGLPVHQAGPASW